MRRRAGQAEAASPPRDLPWRPGREGPAAIIFFAGARRLPIENLQPRLRTCPASSSPSPAAWHSLSNIRVPQNVRRSRQERPTPGKRRRLFRGINMRPSTSTSTRRGEHRTAASAPISAGCGDTILVLSGDDVERPDRYRGARWYPGGVDNHARNGHARASVPV